MVGAGAGTAEVRASGPKSRTVPPTVPPSLNDSKTPRALCLSLPDAVLLAPGGPGVDRSLITPSLPGFSLPLREETQRQGERRKSEPKVAS